LATNLSDSKQLDHTVSSLQLLTCTMYVQTAWN